MASGCFIQSSGAQRAVGVLEKEEAKKFFKLFKIKTIALDRPKAALWWLDANFGLVILCGAHSVKLTL